MAELEDQDAAGPQRPPVVPATQYSLTAADLQFNLSKKETVRSKRQIGLKELQNAINKNVFVTLVVNGEVKVAVQRREMSLVKREVKPAQGNTVNEAKSFSPAKKNDPISPPKPIEMPKPAASSKTANPLLARKSLESSPNKSTKIRELPGSNGPLVDNLKLIAAIALRLVKSPDKSDTKSQTSDTFSSVSSKKTEALSKPKKALPAIYESVHESTPPRFSPEPPALRSRLSDPFRARLVHSVALTHANEQSPGRSFSPTYSAPRSPGKSLDPRTSANPILRHFGRMYGIEETFWTVMKAAGPMGRKKGQESRTMDGSGVGRETEVPTSSQSFRTYDLAHISFDRSLNSRGFSPFRCTKRDPPSSLSQRPSPLY